MFVDVNFVGFGVLLYEVLGGEYVIDFVCVDVEGESVESFVSVCVIVVVDDGYVGLCEVEFWFDDVYDVVVIVVYVE